MGAGASVPDQIDEPTARSLAGAAFDAERFAKLAGDAGTVTRDEFLLAARDFGGGFAGASSAAETLKIGDIVKARPEGEALMVEGTVLLLDADGYVTVDFGDEDTCVVPRANVHKVASWDTLEAGDYVQAQPDGMAIYCNGRVRDVALGADGELEYVVAFDDGEVETLAASRVRKVASARSTRVRLWRKAFHTVNTVNMLRSIVAATASGLGTKVAAAAAAEAKASGSPQHRGRVSKVVLMSQSVDAEEVSSPRGFAAAAAGGEPRTSFLGPQAAGPAAAAPAAEAKPGTFEPVVEVFEIGDIVKCKADGMFFEGVVVHVGDVDPSSGEPACVVELGTEDEPDQQLCRSAEMHKVLPWHHLEVGDRVEAQQDGMALWFRATIAKVHHAEGDYDVVFEEDEEGVGELEEHVPEARIRKVQSVRTFNPKVHWRKLKDVIRASRAFGMFALKSTTLVPAAAS